MITGPLPEQKYRIPRLSRPIGVLAAALLTGDASIAQTLPNSCPVDGCSVTIVAIGPAGDELEMTFDANFTPDVTKNHFHVWWGENYTVQQVGRNAKSAFGVEQGRWHRHDDHPVYVTQGAASTGVRGDATTLCVTAADRGHNVLDPALYHCMNASAHLK